MRAYLYARLNVDLPGYRPKLPPASIRQAFNRARRFFAFARERLGRLDVSRIDQALVDAYARHLRRSEEHTSELQSLMRISYAVFCLKIKNTLTLYYGQCT